MSAYYTPCTSALTCTCREAAHPWCSFTFRFGSRGFALGCRVAFGVV